MKIPLPCHNNAMSKKEIEDNLEFIIETSCCLGHCRESLLRLADKLLANKPKEKVRFNTYVTVSTSIN